MTIFGTDCDFICIFHGEVALGEGFIFWDIDIYEFIVWITY